MTYTDEEIKELEAKAAQYAELEAKYKVLEEKDHNFSALRDKTTALERKLEEATEAAKVKQEAPEKKEKKTVHVEEDDGVKLVREKYEQQLAEATRLTQEMQLNTMIQTVTTDQAKMDQIKEKLKLLRPAADEKELMSNIEMAKVLVDKDDPKPPSPLFMGAFSGEPSISTSYSPKKIDPGVEKEWVKKLGLTYMNDAQ